MSRSIGSPLQYIVHAFLDDLPGSQQARRIEIALNTPLVANTRPGLVKLNTPIYADDVSPGLGHQLQQAGRAGAKVDRWSASALDRLKDALRIRLHKLLVGVGAGTQPSYQTTVPRSPRPESARRDSGKPPRSAYPSVHARPLAGYTLTPWQGHHRAKGDPRSNSRPCEGRPGEADNGLFSG